MYREIYKLEQRNFNGYRRTNHSTDLHTAEAKTIVYKLVPVGIARHTHLRNKAINILGEKRLRFGSQWHPLLDLLIFKTILYQTMTNGFDKNIQETLKRELLSDLKSEEYELFRCLFEATVSRIGKGKYLDNLKGRPRVEKLRQLKTIIEKESELALRKAEEYEISSRSQPTEADQKRLEEVEINEVKLLVRDQMRSVLAIEPLTRAQQYEKFKLFQKKHSLAFKAVLQLDYTNRYYFLMARFSTEPEPVLQKLSQFVSMRLEGTDYRGLTMHFIKDIYSEIKQYDKKVIKSYGRRCPYPFLSPDAIVLDQFALKPLLHFDPLLNQTLGLRDNPESVECRLTFSPTPRGPDYFRTPQQYSTKRQVIEQDPFYGCKQLYEKEKEFLSQDQKREIEGERQDLERESDSILAWRFLLLSYFIVNGEEFGRPQAPTSHQQAIASFMFRLREKQKILSQNAEELGQFFGFATNKVEGAQFKGQFAELEDFISGERDDSMICSHGHDRLLRYLALRWLLVKESNAMLHSKDKEAFSRMLNAKKYVIIFLLVAYQYFSECQQLLRCEQDRTGQRKRVQELVFKVVPRINKDGPEDYMKKLFDRITGYRQRDSKDPGYVYLAENQDYLFKLLSSYNEKIKELKINCQKLNALEKEEEIKDRQLYKGLVEKTAGLISKTAPEIETLLKEIIYIEVEQPRHCENMHKSEKISREGWEVVTLRFLLIVFTLLSISEEKYPLYDSLVVPLLSLAELSPRSEQNLLNAPKSREQIVIQKDQLSTVESIIDYKQLLPPRLTMVRSRIDSYNVYL